MESTEGQFKPFGEQQEHAVVESTPEMSREQKSMSLEELAIEIANSAHMAMERSAWQAAAEKLGVDVEKALELAKMARELRAMAEDEWQKEHATLSGKDHGDMLRQRVAASQGRDSYPEVL